MPQYHIDLPMNTDTVRSLEIGDTVFLSGTILTARDRAHAFLTHAMIEKSEPIQNRALDKELYDILAGSCIYHCGPIMRKEKQGWTCIAAGPTTSIREEIYEAEIIRNFNISGIIGKGDMGKRTAQALKKHGAVYFHAIGGTAALLASCIEKVENVYCQEFGMPEALWKLKVHDFPVIVTMDSTGKSIHKEVKEHSEENLHVILGKSI